MACQERERERRSFWRSERSKVLLLSLGSPGLRVFDKAEECSPNIVRLELLSIGRAHSIWLVAEAIERLLLRVVEVIQTISACTSGYSSI